MAVISANVLPVRSGVFIAVLSVQVTDVDIDKYRSWCASVYNRVSNQYTLGQSQSSAVVISRVAELSPILAAIAFFPPMANSRPLRDRFGSDLQGAV